MDCVTYGIYLACIVGGFTLVYPNNGTVVRVFVWLVVAGACAVAGLRYVK